MVRKTSRNIKDAHCITPKECETCPTNGIVCDQGACERLCMVKYLKFSNDELWHISKYDTLSIRLYSLLTTIVNMVRNWSNMPHSRAEILEPDIAHNYEWYINMIAEVYMKSGEEFTTLSTMPNLFWELALKVSRDVDAKVLQHKVEAVVGLRTGEIITMRSKDFMYTVIPHFTRLRASGSSHNPTFEMRLDVIQEVIIEEKGITFMNEYDVTDKTLELGWITDATPSTVEGTHTVDLIPILNVVRNGHAIALQIDFKSLVMEWHSITNGRSGTGIGSYHIDADPIFLEFQHPKILIGDECIYL